MLNTRMTKSGQSTVVWPESSSSVRTGQVGLEVNVMKRSKPWYCYAMATAS